MILEWMEEYYWATSDIGVFLCCCCCHGNRTSTLRPSSGEWVATTSTSPFHRDVPLDSRYSWRCAGECVCVYVCMVRYVCMCVCVCVTVDGAKE